MIRAEIGQHLHGRPVELEHAGMGGIQQMDEKICHDRFLQRRVEGFHQLVGKLPDESHRIG